MKEAKFKSLAPVLKPYRKENSETWGCYGENCLRTLNSQIFKMLWIGRNDSFPFARGKVFHFLGIMQGSHLRKMPCMIILVSTLIARVKPQHHLGLTHYPCCEKKTIHQRADECG